MRDYLDTIAERVHALSITPAAALLHAVATTLGNYSEGEVDAGIPSHLITKRLYSTSKTWRSVTGTTRRIPGRQTSCTS